MKTITKTAISNLKYNKSRSILTIITITLTTCLLMSLGSICYGIIGYQKEVMGKQYGTFHAVLRDVTEEQVKVLKKHVDVESVGIGELVGSVEKDKLSAYLAYSDATTKAMTPFHLDEGKIPINSNEVAGDVAFFKAMGIQPKLGAKLTIPFRIDGKGKIIEQEFIITGLIHSAKDINHSKAYTVFVSETFIKEYKNQGDRLYSVAIRVKGEDTLNYDMVKERIEDVAKDINVNKKDISLNKEYLFWKTDPGTETIQIGSAIAILIILFSILVIYNIFYVSLLNKIQEYGRLGALGATKKQLKKLVLQEGLILAGISIPIGEVIGYVIAYLGLYYVTHLAGNYHINISVFSIKVILLVTIAVLFTVYCSMRKPMRMASKISPIEAIRYQEGANDKSLIRKGYKEVTLLRMTCANLMRNKKRTLFTITTMGLSCVAFIVIANVLSSVRVSDVARREIEKGDFELKLDYSCNDETYPENNLNELQKLQLLGPKVLDSIQSIPGVKTLETGRAILCKVDKPGWKNKIAVGVIRREDTRKQKEKFVSGTVNYDDLVKNKGAIYTWDVNTFLKEDGLKIGDTIPLIVYDKEENKKTNVKLIGTSSSTDESLVIPEELIESIGIKSDTTVAVYIWADKNKLAAVKKELNSLADQSKYYKLVSLDEEKNTAIFSIRVIKMPIYCILLVVGMIGFMNLINTMITSIVTRKRELGILQAIGLSDKQLVRMLYTEGLFFSLGTIIIALTAGNIFGYLAFLKAKSSHFMDVTVYHYPVIETIGLVIAVTLGQFLVIYIVSKHVHKDTIVNRIRMNE